MRGFVKIIRIADCSDDGMFGILKLNEFPFCVTLEPEFRQNVRSQSCIPVGQHVATRVDSPRFGHTWNIQVWGRDNILFHAGNIVDHTKGCVLLAEHYGKLRGDLAVLNSGETFHRFMSTTTMFDSLLITVVESF